ncbi:MAG TPA: hypothetical protein VHJ19_07850 [Gammaproteobacteria bacterium]|nr:hypothetical protein [Gammaproteobacteria bacterium]
MAHHIRALPPDSFSQTPDLGLMKPESVRCNARLRSAAGVTPSADNVNRLDTHASWLRLQWSGADQGLDLLCVRDAVPVGAPVLRIIASLQMIPLLFLLRVFTNPILPICGIWRLLQ